MPINVYTGLMRSGKSYEVVSMVIVLAILQGRDVVTNVDGISQDKIYDYLEKNHPNADSSKFGKVRHVVNEDVFKPDFFPYFDDHRGEHTDTIVQPGDLVAIDEAWRFWGNDSKIHRHHKSFFLEHGHFTHPVSGVACDLVLMIQDMGTLHRSVKAVVAFSFRTHKKVSLGLGNTYSVTCFEGYKMTKATRTGEWVRRYDKTVFPLYSSFKDGADGKMVNADARQNIFNNKWLWVKLVLFLAVAVFSIRNAWNFFHPVDPKNPATVAPVAGSSGAPGAVVPASSGALSPGVFSSDWRVSGTMTVGTKGVVIIQNSSGQVRFASPSEFQLDGLSRIGLIDGQRVTTFSGQPVKSAFSQLGDSK